MEDTELRQRIELLEKKIDAVFASAEKTRKYFLAVLVVSAVAFIVPLIGLVFTVPSLISMYSNIGNIQ